MPPQVVHVKNAQKVAAALSNEKCQRILDYLGRHSDATESTLAKELSIPLSTVHYNMKVLSEANLVTSNEYTYSAKGKEVTHYKLNKNPIVIVQEDNQLDLLKALVPAALITAGIGIAYKLYTNAQAATLAASSGIADTMMAQEAPEAARTFAAPAMMKTAEATPAATPEVLPWFIAGIVCTIILTFVFALVMRWHAKRLPQ